jgi:hypothetical protein
MPAASSTSSRSRGRSTRSCVEEALNLRRELEKIKVGTFTGPAGSFRQRTEITASQRVILGKLELAEPPRIQQLTPALEAS